MSKPIHRTQTHTASVYCNPFYYYSFEWNIRSICVQFINRVNTYAELTWEMLRIRGQSWWLHLPNFLKMWIFQLLHDVYPLVKVCMQTFYKTLHILHCWCWHLMICCQLFRVVCRPVRNTGNSTYQCIQLSNPP